MMINPAGTVKSAVMSTKWYFALLIAGLAFGMFFLQTGLDLYRVGQKGTLFVIVSAVTGFLYGIVGIPLIAVIAFYILKLTKIKRDIKWTITSFCLSYSGALVYGIIGIIFSVFLGWRTAIAFGVTGVIWAIGPLIASIREITDGNLKISIIIVTVLSSLILLSWSIFNQM